MQTSNREDDFETISTSFEHIFGEPIENAFVAFDDYPSCSTWANQAAIVECSMDPQPWGAGGLDITVSLDYEDDETIGPFGHEIGSPRSIEVIEGGTYEITVSSSGKGASAVARLMRL